MRLKKTSFISILFFLMIGCSQAEDYPTLARQVRSQTANQLEKERDLFCVGTGGQMMGDIQAIELEFQYFHLVNLEESRELLVHAIRTFLKNINDNKELRPYLHNYPFTTKNIEITIWILQPDGHYPPQGDIKCIYLEDGTLKYELVAPEKFTPRPVLHEETYEEALKVLAEKP